MYYPEGMKARVSPVQSIEPHRILAPTRDSNQESPGSESRVVTTILPLHRIDINIFQAMDSRRSSSICRPVKTRASSYDMSLKIAQTCWDSSWLVSFFVKLGMPHRHDVGVGGGFTR